eukprot:m.528969 g.528969  ORF g.528969 m.528969 type:complete len:366 (+) comp57563_c0_seq21:944-2041(+)
MALLSRCAFSALAFSRSEFSSSPSIYPNEEQEEMAASDARKDITISAEHATTEFLLEKHIAYIVQWTEDTANYEYQITEHLRLSGLYWCVSAMDMMQSLHLLQRDAILALVEQCLHPSGGFSAAPQHDAHLLYTLSAVQILCIFDALQQHHIDNVVAFIKSLQLEDGSFQGDRWGEVDTRFSFCALASLALINRLHEVDVEKAVEYISRCINFDGGFGCVPTSETHSGQIYCCISALAVVGELERVDADLIGWWLAERQLPSGGLNGRPEKLPDVCYSWWVVASLSTIGRVHWLNTDKLAAFILACQDQETGGFADRPGDLPDPFHTLFGITALSLLKFPRLKKVNSIFCMSQETIARVLPELAL